MSKLRMNRHSGGEGDAVQCAGHRRNLKTLDRLLRIRNLHLGIDTLHEPSPMTDLSEHYSYNPTLCWNTEVEEYFGKAYGNDHFSHISKALTRPCCCSCIRINTLRTTSGAVIEKLSWMLQETSDENAINIGRGDPDTEYHHMAEVEGKFAGGFTPCSKVEQDNDKMAKSASEVSGLLEGSIKGKPVFKCEIPGLDYVILVRGSGPHKVDYAHAPGQSLKEVIVSRKCAESVLRGAEVYVPGVLACSAHVEKGDTVAVSALVEQPGPDGKWGVGMTRGTILPGLPTDPHYSRRKGLYIGRGTSVLSRAGIFRALEGEAIRVTSRVFDLPSLNNVLEGEIFLQNLPSIIAAHVLDPQKGERILDMCAAPGGKTTAIAMLMKDEGEVVAVDRSHNKVQDIQKLAAELGYKCIMAYKLDALKAVSRRNESDAFKCGEDNINIGGGQKGRHSMKRSKNGPGKNQVSGGRVERSQGFPPSSFDRVLLDAPCSALGLRPRLFAGEETLESLRSHGKYQRRMFDQAVQLVRPGGVIVYSTCTINPGENEALVRYALDTYKFLSLAPQNPRVGGPGLLGFYTYPDDGRVEEWLRPGEEQLVQRFDPSVIDTIGFFIAKFNVGPNPKDA
ncbi:hypothetical protein Dimus_019358 [Dionaea muscipula]